MKKLLVACLVTLATCSMTFYVASRAASAELIAAQPSERTSDDVRTDMNRNIACSLLCRNDVSASTAASCINALTPQELETLAGFPNLSQNAGSPAYLGLVGAALIFIALVYLLWVESNTQDDATGPPERNPAK
jgi:hypothetical protein